MNNNYFEYIDNFNTNKKIQSKLAHGSSHREVVQFTIAIPTYKRPELLEHSLKSAINQRTDAKYEIIIIDNDPLNVEVLSVIKKYKDFKKLYYFRNKSNIGMFGNWNRCIELARGEYITILNDDDWLSTDFLQVSYDYLLKNDVDGLIFKNNRIDNRKKSENQPRKKKYNNLFKLIGRYSKKLSLMDFFYGNKSSGTLGVLFKVECLRKLGGYNPDYFPSSDYILHANYCYKFVVHRINRKLNYYRIEENESANQNTLRIWEGLDNSIRLYFLEKMNKKNQLYLHINRLVQFNRIEGMQKTWSYRTNTSFEYTIQRKILKVFLIIKNQLNI